MIPKGVEKDALGASGAAQNQAAAAYAAASPIYQDMATHPTGYSSQQLAGFNTAAQQSAGGGVASAVGQGNLMAGRTGNIGGYQVAADSAARMGAADQGAAALQVQNQNAELQQKQQQIGLAGLSGIYDDANSTGQGYLKTAGEAAANNPWMKLLQQTIASGGEVGRAAVAG